MIRHTALLPCADCDNVVEVTIVAMRGPNGSGTWVEVEDVIGDDTCVGSRTHMAWSELAREDLDDAVFQHEHGRHE